MRRRPQSGSVWVFRRTNGDIAWTCDACDDEGVITGWKGSPTDLSGLDDSYADGDEVVLLVAREPFEVIRGVFLLDDAIPAQHRGHVLPATPLRGCSQRNAGTQPSGRGEVTERVAADGVWPVGFRERQLAGTLPSTFLEMTDIQRRAGRAREHERIGRALLNITSCVRRIAASDGGR